MRPVTFTFYSYKGGVGRTLLAANMALALARQGKTLLWDLDVEAPGMHRISALRDTGEIKAGFFNWLETWQEKKNRVPDEDACQQFMQLVRETPYTNLAMLPAHGDQADSLALYYQVDWHALLVTDPTLARDVLNGLLDHLGQQGYRHVVLDSRTGLSDLGGLLAGALPDATVLVGGYAPQNLHGLAQIGRSLAVNNETQRSLRGRDAAVQLFYVASPIPQDNPRLVEAGRGIWAREFGLDMAAVQEIRFDPELPFSEELLITRPERRIAQDYERFAAELIAFADIVWQAQQEQDSEITARPDIFAAAGADDPHLDMPFDSLLDARFGGHLGGHAGQRVALSFEEQMAQLLRLLGYSVAFADNEARAKDGHTGDLIARIESGLDSTTYLVQCKAANIPKSMLEAMRARLELPDARAMQARGMVLGRSFAPAAQTYAKDHGIQALMPLELERRLLDFAPLLNKIVGSFEPTPLARAYVRQTAKRGNYGAVRDESKAPKAKQGSAESESKSIDDLVAHGLDWANGAGKRLWVLLGDYGTGKTAFSQKLEYELAKLARQDGQRPLPLRINLREFPNKVTLEELLAEAWQRATGQRKDPAVLLYLIERGRIVLLLDSFDEMGLATAGRSVVEQFRSLVRVAGSAGYGDLANRVLITCREQFFKDHGEATSAMSGRHADIEAQSALQGLALGFDGSIDTVAMFTTEQIAEFLQKRLGKDAGQAALAFLQRQNLMQLGDRPQLLDIIIQSLPRLKEQEHLGGRPLSTGALYQIYTDQWLEDFKPVERQSNSHQLRLILEMLAQVLWQRVGNRIHYGDLYALVKDRKDLRGKLDPNQLDVELRTAAFLSRTPDGFYGFSHRSFLEYFLARRIEHASCHCGETGQQDELIAVLDVPRLSLEVCGFVADLAAPEGEQASTRRSLRDSIRVLLTAPAGNASGAPATSRVNALLLSYRLAQQQARQTGTDEAEPWLAPAAWLAGVDLSKLDLAGLVAPGADFSAANLSGATLDDAVLPGANLQHVSLRRASLQRADLTGANVQAADFMACNAQAARLQLANARDSVWINARLEQAELADADFTAADLRNANLSCVQGLPVLAEARLDAACARGAKGWGKQHRALRLPRWQQLVASPSIGHFGNATGLAFAADGQRLAGAGGGGSITLWDSACGKQVGHIGEAQAAWYCVDYSAGGRFVAGGGAQGWLQLWDMGQGNAGHQLTGHDALVRDVKFSPDGQYLASADAKGGVCLWLVARGELLQKWSEPDASRRLAFSTDGQWLASAGQMIVLWEIASGEAKQRLAPDDGQAKILQLAFNAEGSQLIAIARSGAVCWWDVVSGALLQTVATQNGGGAGDIDIGTQKIAIVSRGGTSLLDIQTGKVVWQRPDLRIFFDGLLRFGQTGRQLAVSTDEHALACLDAQTGERAWQVLWNFRLTWARFSPDNQWLANGGPNETVLWLWDVHNGMPCGAVQIDEGGLFDAPLFSANSRELGIGAKAGLVSYEVRTGQRQGGAQSGHGAVLCHAASADQRYWATCGYAGAAEEVLLLDGQDGKLCHTLMGHKAWVRSIAFHPTRMLLASVGDDGILHLWAPDSGKLLQRINCQQGQLRCVAFSPDGQRLASSGDDGSLCLWTVENGLVAESSVLRIPAHRGNGTKVAFHPNSLHCATAGADGTVRIWAVENGALLCTLLAPTSWCGSLTFSPNGQQLAHGGAAGITRIWNATNNTYPLEWLLYQDPDQSHLAAQTPGQNPASEDGEIHLPSIQTGGLAKLASWYSVDFRHDPRGLWRGNGPALEKLQYRDNEPIQPAPWLPRDWRALDLPELKAPD